MRDVLNYALLPGVWNYVDESRLSTHSHERRAGTVHRPEARRSLPAAAVFVFDGRAVAARHQRIVAKHVQSVELDHYLAISRPNPVHCRSTTPARAQDSGLPPAGSTGRRRHAWACLRPCWSTAPWTPATVRLGSPPCWKWVRSVPVVAVEVHEHTSNIPPGILIERRAFREPAAPSPTITPVLSRGRGLTERPRARLNAGPDPLLN
ncbi:hypothetical protein ABIB29_003651 [Arthrobacter sp. UYEF36]